MQWSSLTLTLTPALIFQLCDHSEPYVYTMRKTVEHESLGYREDQTRECVPKACQVLGTQEVSNIFLFLLFIWLTHIILSAALDLVSPSEWKEPELDNFEGVFLMF